MNKMMAKNSLVLLLLAVATLVVYSNSFTIQFQFDDNHTIVSNLAIRSLNNLPRFFIDANTFSYRPENSGYRPMATTAAALGFFISGLKPWGYHLIKLIEHTLVAFLIFLVGLKLLPSSLTLARQRMVAFFAALIFAVHRANTETVDYICAVSSLQAGLFYLTAFYWFIRFLDSKKNYWLVFSGVSFFLAMLSKEEAVTLPAMVFLVQWYREKSYKNIKSWVLYTLPYVGLAVLFVVLRTTFQSAIADTSRGNMAVATYFITQFRSWLHYWTLFFWPLNLNADNLSFEFSQSVFEPRVLMALAIHLIVGVGAWWARAKNKFITFAILWMYITVLPASSVFVLVEAVNEHRMYIPYMLLSLLSVYGLLAALAKIDRHNGFSLGCGLLVLASSALGAGTYARNQVWQTDITLWEDIYAKNPQSFRAMNVLGISLINHDQLERGVQLLEECRRINEYYPPCVVHLSIAYARLKKYQEGLAILKKMHQLAPDYVHLNFHLGIYYKEYFGDYKLALQHLQAANQASSGRFVQATIKVAEMALEDRQFNNAFAILNSILAYDQSNAEAWEAVAKGHILMNNLAQAQAIYAKLLAAAPRSFRFLLGQANILERQGDFLAATRVYDQAIESYPLAIQAWQGLLRTAEKTNQINLKNIAQQKINELKASNQWEFFPSMFLINEKPRQIGPQL